MIRRATGVSGTFSHHISTSVSFAITACWTGLASAPRRRVRLIQGILRTPTHGTGPRAVSNRARCSAIAYWGGPLIRSDEWASTREADALTRPQHVRECGAGGLAGDARGADEHAVGNDEYRAA